MQQQQQQINSNSVISRPILSGLNMNTLNQQQRQQQQQQQTLTKQQKLDTQTVLQLIYQQQHFNDQVNSVNNSTSSSQAQSQAQAQAAARYKTELCRSYQENGICKYGDKCQFAHGGNELRTMTRHPKYKTELCRTFHAAGYCPYGPRCHFVHDTQIDTTTMRAQKQQSPKQLTLKLSSSSSPSSSSSSSSSSTSPLSLNQFNFDLNNDLERIFTQQQQVNQNTTSLLMYANEFSSIVEKPTRKESTSSCSSGIESVFSGSSSSSTSESISPPSSRSLSPDFLFAHTNNTQSQSTRKFYDDWDLTSTDSIVHQILSNIVSLDNNTTTNTMIKTNQQQQTSTFLNENDIDDSTINYLSMATSNLFI